jgi:hypothetical protein
MPRSSHDLAVSIETGYDLSENDSSRRECAVYVRGRHSSFSKEAHVLADLEKRLLIDMDVALATVLDDLIELLVVALLPDLLGNFS